MTMKIVILKDSGEHKAGYEGFVPRPLGIRLCKGKMAVPWCQKDRISPAEKSAITKAKKLAEKEAKRIAKEKKAKVEKAKADKLLKESVKPKAETAFSKKRKYY